jgi:rubrerythrin
MKDEEVRGLLYQALETELGGVQVYRTALRCVVNKDLKKEWEEYLEQTENHVRIVENVFTRLGLDPEAEPPGRLVVRHLGESLVKAMEMALEAGKPAAAQLVAAECVVLAETKDHLNWELIGELAKKAKGEQGSALKEAYKEVEEEEDEHLYHTAGWSRELWIETLGMPAVLPPPEEEKEVKTAIGAARAKLARQDMRRPAMAKKRTTSRSRGAANPSTTRSKTGRFTKDHTNTRTRGSDTARRSRTAEERKSGSRLGTSRD